MQSTTIASEHTNLLCQKLPKELRIRLEDSFFHNWNHQSTNCLKINNFQFFCEKYCAKKKVSARKILLLQAEISYESEGYPRTKLRFRENVAQSREIKLSSNEQCPTKFPRSKQTPTTEVGDLIMAQRVLFYRCTAAAATIF